MRCGSRRRPSFALVFVSRAGNPLRCDAGDGARERSALRAWRPWRPRGPNNGVPIRRPARDSVTHSRSVCGPRSETAKSLVADTLRRSCTISRRGSSDREDRSTSSTGSAFMFLAKNPLRTSWLVSISYESKMRNVSNYIFFLICHSRGKGGILCAPFVKINI